MADMLTATATEDAAAYGVARIGEAFVGIAIDFLSEVCKINALQQMLVRSAYLTGGFDLRGRLIPVINLPRICGIDDPAVAPKFAVVLRRDDQLMAFLVDEVIGIIQLPARSLQPLHHGGDKQTCLTGVILDSNRLISVVDVPQVFDLPGIFSVKMPMVTQGLAADADRNSMLTFVAGGARFSVQAVDIYGTVPRQTIEMNSMSSGYCLGCITYHQRRVPVMSIVDILGIGQSGERKSSEVVILRCPQDQLLGLAVDSIQDIQALDARRLSAVPDAIARRTGFLSGVHVKEDGTQIYVIATDRMIADPQIAATASLSSPARVEVPSVGEAGPIAGNTRHLTERFLIFQAGRAVAVPLEQVNCIIPTPRTVVPTRQNSVGLLGFFPRSHDSIPLVDLNVNLGLPSGGSDQARVLLTGEGVRQTGFQVERVHGIETSNWLLSGLRPDGPGAETLVQLGSGPARRLLPVIDLAAIVAEHFAVKGADRSWMT